MSAMRAELRHRLIALFPDDAVADPPCRSMTLATARGTVAGVHVLLNGLTPGQPLKVRVTCAGRAAHRVQWFRLVDVPVEKNTDTRFGLEKEGRINPHVIRRAPFRIYDAMAPMLDETPVACATMALRLHLAIPAGARPGARSYRIELTSGGESASMMVRLDVFPARVTPVGSRSFPYTNWFSYTHIAERHGLAMWSPAYWAMLARYARLMAHGRQNMFWLPMAVLFDGPRLNIGRMQRLVGLFSAAGLHWIEGGHIGPIAGDALVRAEKHADAARALIALRAAIEANGWTSRWRQHVTDEPCGAEAVAAYRGLAGLVRKTMPGIPIMDAVMDPALMGAADIWVIQNDEVRNHLARFQALREFGDQVWLYTCMGPGGKGLNRLLDMELIRCTLLSWQCVANRFDGFLHWGLNHYRDGQDPFRQSVVGDLPAGDTHIVYPGSREPWSSLRLEAQREGMEDIELLRQLRRSHSRTCDRIVRSVVRNGWDYTTDVRVLDAARRRLLAALT